MASLTVSVPDEMKAFVERETSKRGLASEEEYLNILILEERKRKAEEHLEELLLEGIDSPTTVVDARWWERFRSRILKHRTQSSPP